MPNTARKRPVYSIRRARLNLVHAIQDEIRATLSPSKFVAHSTVVALREAAIRDLIEAVRAAR